MNDMSEDCLQLSYKIEATRRRKLQKFVKVKGSITFAYDKRIYIQKEGVMNCSDMFTYSETKVIQVNKQVVICDILKDM